METTINKWTDPDGNQYHFKDEVARAQNRETIKNVDLERKRIDNLVRDLPNSTGEYQQSKMVLHGYGNATAKCGTTSGQYTNVPAFTTDTGGTLSSLYTKKSNYQIAVNKAGLYLFELRIHINSLTANKRVELAPFVNGERNAALASSYNTAGNFTLTKIATLPIWLSANDTIDFRIAPIEAAEVSVGLGDVLVYAIDWDDKFKIPDYTGYVNETKDLRVGVDGTIYDTAGQAMREQIGLLKEDLSTLIEDNPEYLRAIVDAEGKFLWGIRNDGVVVYGAGIPEQIKIELEGLSREITEKLSNLDENFSEKLDAAVNELGHTEDNPEFLRVILDADGKVLWGIKTNGEITYGVGVPEQIRDEIGNMNIKVKELQQGIDKFGLYCDENGNICQEV